MSSDNPYISATDIEQNSKKVEEIEMQLAELQTIMGKIESNAYGVCEACGSALDLQTLRSNPVATLCSEHAPGEARLI